jgi:hypothetical protein
MAEPAHANKESRHAAPTTSARPPVASGDELTQAPVERQAERLLSDPRLGSAAAAQRARLVQRLQRGQGNAFVARLVQRAAVADPPKPQKLEPHQDPKFAAVEQKIGHTAKQEKQHASPKSKVKEAQGAAAGPPNDVASQAAATQVDKMAQQKPGEFDKKAFMEAVKKAIEAAAPKNLEQADEFKQSDKAARVKSDVSSVVGKGKQDSAAAIKQADTEPPDASNAKPKAVTPMGDEKSGAAPGAVGAAQALPSPKTAAETSMAAGPAEVNQQMAQADLTEEQLKNSNEPQFNDALGAKKTAEQHSEQAPEQYKAAENQTLAKAGADATGTAANGLAGMHAEKAHVLAAVSGNKTGAKTQDEGKRAEVAGKIETIFNQTRTEVTAILDGLDAKVNSEFDAGEKDARTQFETYVAQKMTAYKAKRYSGTLGWTLWLKDKVMDMPAEVNAFYSDGRAQYLKQMEGVISRVADIVGAELGKAKKRIADGRQQVKEFVASQPKELQQVARDAEQQISGKFDQLDSDVNSKQDALVQSLADKYVAARDALDDRINQLKAENKGLVSAAKDAIGGVIQTIMQLKDMLLNVLQKAANVIGDIIKDPIKFLGNLVGAIKQGLNQFVANILTHLKKGLMGWLFGTLGEAGLQLPDSFDLKGILSLILQVLGLTYENVRGIAVKIAGEKVVSAVEGTVKFFMTLAKEGPAGLWQWLKDKIAEINIKDTVIGAIKDFVVTRIITAGITWLIGLLNPAAAFVKACKMIYDVIMFFIERGSQIMEFVNSILDGLGAIVAGSLGAAANLVESSLAKILPLAISFLASLLGVGGIAEKIKEIIEKIRAPINKLVTAIIHPLLGPLKKLYDKGAKFVKGAIDKGKALGQKAIGKVKGALGSKSGDATSRTDTQKQTALATALAESNKQLGVTGATPASVRAKLPGIKSAYGLDHIDLVHESGYRYHVDASISRMASESRELGGGDLSPELTAEERAQLTTVKGGPELLKLIDSIGNPRLRATRIDEARVALEQKRQGKPELEVSRKVPRELSPGEISDLKKKHHRQDLVAQIEKETDNTKRAELIAEARRILGGREETLTELDVETAEEVIQVGSERYGPDDKKLEDDHDIQITKTIDIVRREAKRSGKPPRKVIVRLTNPKNELNPKLIERIRAKGRDGVVVDVKVGRP